MTNEQREAIKNLDEFANTKYGAFSAKEGQTVLSLIKEQQEEIDLMAEYIAINGVEKDICNEKRIEENCETHHKIK